MLRIGKSKLSIPQKLWLLTIIPTVGMIAAGAMSFHTLYSEYQGFEQDAARLKAFRQEVSDFVAMGDQLSIEREAALQVFAHPRDSQRLRDFKSHFADTDRSVKEMGARLSRYAKSPEAAAFADKDKMIRDFFDTQLPLARDGVTGGKLSSGEVYTIYMKLAYEALFISECYRTTIHTPQGLNVFDAVLALQKIHQQEMVGMNLTLYGMQQGSLTKDEVSLLRRQLIDSTEEEYYVLKFQPELRAFFRSKTRGTDDDTAFYDYLSKVAGSQRDGSPLPAFKPKSGTVQELVGRHFAAYPSVYAYGFTLADSQLRAVAEQRQRRAGGIGAALLAGIVLSLGANLMITRSTRQSLRSVSHSIAQASEDVNEASSQLTSAGDEISHHVTNYAQAIDRISQSLDKVSSVAETNKNHVTAAATTTARARDSVDAGLDTITELDHAMNSARASAQKINQIIARINELSFQTNLLALNAAVEAARAGAAGAGFAVVADEVRGLASRCAEAARETTELIEHSAQDTATAISKSDELAGRFKSVSRNIHEVNEIVTMISTNFRQQASSISEISQSVSKQRKIAQSIATEAQQTASTALSMENQVNSLKTSVQRMDSMLGGQVVREPPAIPAPEVPRLAEVSV
jgi:methyl-accepting chemotaxis protein